MSLFMFRFLFKPFVSFQAWQGLVSISSKPCHSYSVISTTIVTMPAEMTKPTGYPPMLPYL